MFRRTSTLIVMGLSITAGSLASSAHAADADRSALGDIPGQYVVRDRQCEVDDTHCKEITGIRLDYSESDGRVVPSLTEYSEYDGGKASMQMYLESYDFVPPDERDKAGMTAIFPGVQQPVNASVYDAHLISSSPFGLDWLFRIGSTSDLEIQRRQVRVEDDGSLTYTHTFATVSTYREPRHWTRRFSLVRKEVGRE